MNEQNGNEPNKRPGFTRRYELLKASGALSIHELHTNPQFKGFYDAHREAIDQIDALEHAPAPATEK